MAKQKKIYPPCDHHKPWRVYISQYPHGRYQYLWITSRCTFCDKRLASGRIPFFCDEDKVPLCKLAQIIGVSKSTLKKMIKNKEEWEGHRLIEEGNLIKFR